MPVGRVQVARANAGSGLNVVMCFEGWAQDGFSPEQTLIIRKKQSQALRLALSGYRIKEFLANVIGEESLQWMLDAGAHLRRNYSRYFRKKGLPEPKPWLRPWLVGLSREEAFAHPGTNLGARFIYTPPRFDFNRSEQLLLQHALMGQTCEELATSLSISHWTAKQRWHAIYDRVTEVDRELLPPPITYGPCVSSRGPERRRRLLNYLRQHPEELRPYQLARQRRGTRRAPLSAIKMFIAGTAFLAPNYLQCLSEYLV